MQVAAPKFDPTIPWRPFQADYINDPGRLIFCVKGAQIGMSTASAAWAVGECIARDNHLVIILSRTEPQAKELARKAKMLVQKLKGVEAHLDHGFFKDTLMLEHYIRFPNNSRIIALSSNPETARGYTGDVVLDEYAFHPQSEEIFKAAYRQITLGYKMRILSTPNGQQGRFYDMAKKFGLADGHEPTSVREARLKGARYVKDGWSLHWVDIHRAIAEGFPVDADEIRQGAMSSTGDEDTWLQEFLCQFISTAQQWIPPELMDAPNIDTLVTQELGQLGNNPPSRDQYRNLYAGWDIARHKDLSVIWFNEVVGDITVCRGILELSKRPTPEQIEEARRVLAPGPPRFEGGPPTPPLVYRMAIDTGSMGLTIFEVLQKEFGSGQVEGVTFTLQAKEAMAVEAKRRMEERRVRIPDTPMVRNSFRSVKKTVTATGQARFDADHDEKYGHADHWWAWCLAISAESGCAVHPLVQLWGQQVKQREIEAQHLAETVPVGVDLATAQANLAQQRGIFGADRFLTDPGAVVAPRPQPKPNLCPQCHQAVSVYGEVAVCRGCGWKGMRSSGVARN